MSQPTRHHRHLKPEPHYTYIFPTSKHHGQRPSESRSGECRRWAGGGRLGWQNENGRHEMPRPLSPAIARDWTENSNLSHPPTRAQPPLWASLPAESLRLKVGDLGG